MNTISSLSQPSAGISGALLENAARTALDSTQPEMTISQMSRLFGVSLRTLRFYEDRGLIKPRREGNARYDRGTDRIRLEMILKGKKLGFLLRATRSKPQRKRELKTISCSWPLLSSAPLRSRLVTRGPCANRITMP